MKFNEKLIELRKREGLSQEELGYRLNVTRQTVSKWELGQTTPEMDKLSEIGRLFNISLDELINESEIQNDSVNPIIEDQPIMNEMPKNNKFVIIIVVALIVVVSLIIIKIFTAISGVNTVNKVLDSQGNVIESVEDTQQNIFERFFSLFERFFDLFEKAIDSQDEIFDNSTNMKQETENMIGNIIENSSNMNENAENIIENMTENLPSDFEKRIFNNSLEIHAGSANGMIVISVLDDIITSNKTKERKIVVEYNGIKTQYEKEIKNIKGNFKTFDKCEITYGYDEQGFINKAIVEKL